MTTVMRHGGDSHYMRPDGVYKTAVLQPLVGYSPQQDVMNVAQEFTQGPYSFQQGGMGLGGLGRRAPVALLGPYTYGMHGPYSYGYSGPVANAWGKMKLWWQSVRAKWRMRFHKGVPMGVQGLGFTPFGPAAWAGPQVVGDPSQRMGMLIAMAQKDLPTDFQAMNASLIYQRWMSLRMPTR